MLMVMVSLLLTIAVTFWQYMTPNVLRNRKAGPVWILYLKLGAFYTNFTITTPEIIISLKRSAWIS